MSLVFPFPLRGTPDASKDPVFGFLALADADSQPFRHCPSSITSLLAIVKNLPNESGTDHEEGSDEWKIWYGSGSLKRTAKAWVEKDDFCAWSGAQLFPDLLEKTAAEVLRDPTCFEGLSGKAWIAKLISKLQEPSIADKAILKGVGKEPEHVGASYEEWHGYKPSLGAENREDWWKAGGREGIAETKEYHDWSMRDVVLKRCWPLFLQIVAYLVDEKHQDLVDRLRGIEGGCKKRLESYLERYGGRKVTPADETSKAYGAYLKSCISASLEEKELDEATIKKVASRILSSDFGNDPRALEWYDALLLLKADLEPGEYHFPSTLNGYKRALVHQLAKSLGLKSISEGIDVKSQEGRKQKKRADKKGQNIVARHVVVKNHE